MLAVWRGERKTMQGTQKALIRPSKRAHFEQLSVEAVRDRLAETTSITGADELRNLFGTDIGRSHRSCSC
jgi:hypothetical protein